MIIILNEKLHKVSYYKWVVCYNKENIMSSTAAGLWTRELIQPHLWSILWIIHTTEDMMATSADGLLIMHCIMLLAIQPCCLFILICQIQLLRKTPGSRLAEQSGTRHHGSNAIHVCLEERSRLEVTFPRFFEGFHSVKLQRNIPLPQKRKYFYNILNPIKYRPLKSRQPPQNCLRSLDLKNQDKCANFCLFRFCVVFHWRIHIRRNLK